MDHSGGHSNSNRAKAILRQWSILKRLNSPLGANESDLMAEFQVQRRTIYRDLRVLEMAGFPIYDETIHEHGRGNWKVWRLITPLKKLL